SWLAAPHSLGRKTAERYNELARWQIIPFLGDVVLQKLRPAHIEQWHGELLAAGGKGGRPLAARTVGNAHRVLHRALERAVLAEVVSRNVAHLIKPPEVKDADVMSLRAEQIQSVLGALVGHPLQPIAVLALSTGARRGEILGLAWRHVDLDDGTITIARTLEQAYGQLTFKAPKTKHGKRTIALPRIAVDALRAHRLRQLELRLAQGEGKPGPDALVFCTLEGNPIPPGNLSRDWRKFVKAHKLPEVSFHGLRHSHASALIAAKIDPVSVAHQLGHGSPVVTMRIYAHKFGELDTKAADAIEATLRTGKER
ncbi:MAG: tyrosine-type recombinase/integrase, partial [Xanthobacteraceae bacterium]